MINSRQEIELLLRLSIYRVSIKQKSSNRWTITEVKHSPDFELIKDTPYLSLTGELWCPLWVAWKKRPRNIGSALYMATGLCNKIGCRSSNPNGDPSLTTVPSREWYITTCMALHKTDGLVQDCSNSIIHILESLQSCTKPSKLCFGHQHGEPGASLWWPPRIDFYLCVWCYT